MFKKARKFHIKNEVYWYTIGKTTYIKKDGKPIGNKPRKIGIIFPDGSKIFPSVLEVLNCTQKEYNNRATYCDMCECMCDVDHDKGIYDLDIDGPGTIKKYVERIIKHV